MEPGIKRFSFAHMRTGGHFLASRILHPDWPWWPKEAVRLCDELLKKTDIVVEFGSGRSTCWLAGKCARVISIEHDERWYRLQKANTIKKKLEQKIELIHAPVLKETSADKQPYLLSVQGMPDSSADVVIVDGRYRAYTARLSLRLLKPGGFLIIEDAHRYFFPEKPRIVLPGIRYQEVWEEACSQIKNWRSIRTKAGAHFTDFFIKP